LKRDGSPVGLCGLVRRDGLDDVDLGFGLLERWAGHGYAYEAAVEVVRQAREELSLTRIAAITLPDNQRSVALLEKLGMRLERTIRLPGEQADLSLYGMELRSP
jgi:ribosomal-protein-alanine N-acetyltransferase